jgi:hypothetical protein
MTESILTRNIWVEMVVGAWVETETVVSGWGKCAEDIVSVLMTLRRGDELCVTHVARHILHASCCLP